MAEIKELLAEIAELSDKVTFKEDNSLPVRKPSFLITNPSSDQGHVLQAPAGPRVHLAGTGVAVDGGHPSKEAQSLLEQIAILTVILNSKPITRSLATTARTWCRR
ncbi:hypothetical protein ACNKHX_03220 [Shigella flexneri]